MIRLIIVKIIELYQRTLSPDTGWFKSKYPGGYCKFKPNCSEYCKQAVQKYGVITGGAKGMWRILRCNPWSHGGWDPVD